MPFDPTRLYSSLLNTGLQQKDNPLYQVINNLIQIITQMSIEIEQLKNNNS